MISIIIPVYKVEKYLPSCLDSILAQTYQDWEAILVDDGSPDNSGKICDEYAQKDKRFLVIHKPNGGVSSARNMALDTYGGEYVTFIDSDDLLAPETLEVCLKRIQQDGTEMAYFQCQAIHPNGQLYGNTTDIEECKLDNVEFCKRFMSGLYTAGICGKFYHRDIIKDLRFDASLRVGEDKMFLFHALYNRATSISILNDRLYYYRILQNSAIRSNMDSGYKLGQILMKYEIEVFDKIQRNTNGEYNAVFANEIIQLALRMKGWFFSVTEEQKEILRKFLPCIEDKNSKVYKQGDIILRHNRMYASCYLTLCNLPGKIKFMLSRYWHILRDSI